MYSWIPCLGEGRGREEGEKRGEEGREEGERGGEEGVRLTLHTLLRALS